MGLGSVAGRPSRERLEQQPDAVFELGVERLPLALRVDGFSQTVNPLWPSYVVRDVREMRA